MISYISYLKNYPVGGRIFLIKSKCLYDPQLSGHVLWRRPLKKTFCIIKLISFIGKNVKWKFNWFASRQCKRFNTKQKTFSKHFGFHPTSPISPLTASTKTIPKIDPPKAKYIILEITNSPLFLDSKDDSDRNAHFNIHIPGSIKTNTAERLPSTLITAPMFGITSANINDKTNHTVTQT